MPQAGRSLDISTANLSGQGVQAAQQKLHPWQCKLCLHQSMMVKAPKAEQLAHYCMQTMHLAGQLAKDHASVHLPVRWSPASPSTTNSVY